MARCFLLRAVFFFLMVPAAVSAAALDDYYLARFGERGPVARALAAAAPGETQADRCGTPLHRSLKRDWARLEPATQKVLAKEVSRPTLYYERSFPSPGGHFTIHYASSGSDAPDPGDADADGIPDWVEKVAAVFDHVYSVEIGDMGYRAPTANRYDVYLRSLITEGAYGFTTDDGMPTYPGTSARSYIEIDRAFTDPLFTANGTYTPEQALQVTAAHEFHHAIQYSYNYYFDMWYAEVTSTWMEDEVYDAVNQLYSYLPKYLPLAGTLPLNAPLGGNSEYGRWIFNRYLAEAHSASTIKDVWDRLAATAAPPSGEDIPMLPLIDAVARSGGSTLAADFLGFAKRVYLRDWSTHAADISLIPAVATQLTYASYPVSMSAISAAIAAQPGYTFAFYRFLPAFSAARDLTLTLGTLPQGVDVVAIKRGTNGSVEQYTLDGATGTITIPSFNSTATAEVALIVAKGGGESAAPVAVSSGSGKSSGCFIATAAYGSYLHPKVALLRDFRDRHLLSNAPGRLFVSLYYRVSPPVAQVIAKHPWMRAAVRVLLTPVVLGVEYPGMSAVLMALGCLGMGWRRGWLGLPPVGDGKKTA